MFNRPHTQIVPVHLQGSDGEAVDGPAVHVIPEHDSAVLRRVGCEHGRGQTGLVTDGNTGRLNVDVVTGRISPGVVGRRSSGRAERAALVPDPVDVIEEVVRPVAVAVGLEVAVGSVLRWE